VRRKKMVKSATINTRIDEKTKTQAQNILRILNIPMSEAISMFFKQIVLHRGIPFEIKIPNDVTVETFEKTDAGKELHKVSGIEELAKELKS